jgi:hypothetical protein
MSATRCAGIFFLASWVLSAAALAQGSSVRERILSDPFAEFNKAVPIAAAMARPFASTRGGEVAIDFCMYNSEWGETPDDDFLEHFQHIVQQRVHMSKLLLANGYPGTVIGGPLAAIAARYLREVQRRRKDGLDLRDSTDVKAAILPLERQLAERMNAYREQFAPGLAQPTVWEKCGGDYVGYVKLKSVPDGGTIRLIREFYYKFCAATGIQPLSDGCDKWSVIAGNRDVPGGIYYYLVSWPNGLTECDRIEFTGATADENEKTITINQSGKGCAK